jgi:aryl-alcohol dehydrogenase-like predicted oxidoreductase
LLPALSARDTKLLANNYRDELVISTKSGYDMWPAHVRALDQIAGARGQSLAQLALSWALRDQRVTSPPIGASSVAQLEENLAAAGMPSRPHRVASRKLRDG